MELIRLRFIQLNMSDAGESENAVGDNQVFIILHRVFQVVPKQSYEAIDLVW